MKPDCARVQITVRQVDLTTILRHLFFGQATNKSQVTIRRVQTYEPECASDRISEIPKPPANEFLPNSEQ